MRRILFIPVISIFLFVAACSKNGTGGANNPDCSTAAKAFAADVNPIIQGRCNLASCHAAGSTNGPGPLTSHSEVFNARALIRTAVNSGTMPQGSALSATQKNSIICWIDSGAPNN